MGTLALAQANCILARWRSMRLIRRKKISDFCQCHADARSQLTAWASEVKFAEWRRPDDIKARYASASFLAGNVVVFNIKGNKYRLAVRVDYDFQAVEILAVGTHADYNEWSF